MEAVIDSEESFSLLGLSLSLLVGFLKLSLELEPALEITEFAFAPLTWYTDPGFKCLVSDADLIYNLDIRKHVKHTI